MCLVHHCQRNDHVCEHLGWNKTKEEGAYLERRRDADNCQVLLFNPLSCTKKAEDSVCSLQNKNHTSFLFKKSQFRTAPLNHCNYLLGLQITQSCSKHKQVPPCKAKAPFSQRCLNAHQNPAPDTAINLHVSSNRARVVLRQQNITWELSPTPTRAPLDRFCCAPCKQSCSSCLRSFLACCLGDIMSTSYETFKYIAGK